MINRTSVAVLTITLFVLGIGMASHEGSSSENADPELARILADYTRLYTRETLPEWRTLFHSAASIANLGSDGAINVRTLDTFYSAQENYFATGRRINERLKDVAIAPGKNMARVTADFVFRDEGEERRGKLGIHLLRQGQGWKIVGIVFSYD